MEKHKVSEPRFVYRGVLSPAVGLLLLAPMAFLFFSAAAIAAAGGAALALFLPLLTRRRPRTNRDAGCIVLGPDEYSRVDDESPRLPHR